MTLSKRLDYAEMNEEEFGKVGVAGSIIARV